MIRTFGYVNNMGGKEIVKCFNEGFDHGLTKIVINLAESKVVNSIGISYLLEIIEKLMDKKGKLVFTNLEPAIEKTFSIMGLFHFAEHAATEETAIAKMGE
ncbi:STAS domain-containing protein [candidate division KSB1 bacterium]|nr:STAS domain-containing protein [candidate division KSB1 bacterium]